MIVTLTLNPSLDRTVEVDSLDPGRGHPGRRAPASTRAARASTSPGPCWPTGCRRVAVRPVRRRRGRPARPPARGGGRRDRRRCRSPDATRSNITLAEPDGTITKFNEPGAGHAPRRARRRRRRACWPRAGVGRLGRRRAAASRPGLPRRRLRAICAGGARRGISVAVDTSGPALRGRAGRPADPGQAEPRRAGRGRPACRWRRSATWSRPPSDLRAWGAGTVLASLGADGAVLVDADGVVTGERPVVRPRSSVGAGDAMLAGFLAARRRSGAAALAEALAWGAAAVRLPGSRMPGARATSTAPRPLQPSDPTRTRTACRPDRPAAGDQPPATS